MRNVAIIPLRKGSKGIPGKNKKKVLGRPLYQWVLAEAIKSNLDKVFVYTDDNDILELISKEYKWTNKIEGLERSDESATDIASTETAMIEFAKKIEYDFDNIFLLQATSPLTRHKDINNGIEKLEAGADSIISVVNTKRFIWDAKGKPLNYDYFNRPRRQDFDGLHMENGAIYGTTKNAFRKSDNRISGNIELVFMDEASLIEIDEPHDFTIISSLLEKYLLTTKTKIKKIQAIVFDIDGVMTDGTVLTSNGTEIAKSFSLRDGMGISFLKDENIIPIVLTSEDSEIVKTRINKLNIKEYYPGVKDKYSRLNNILTHLNITRSSVGYVGDDINDLSNMLSVGWSFCPQNALPDVKSKADYILQNKGGDLAVREAIEMILKYNQRFK